MDQRKISAYKAGELTRARQWTDEELAEVAAWAEDVADFLTGRNLSGDTVILLRRDIAVFRDMAERRHFNL